MNISGFDILSCPHCGQLYKDSQYMSYNTVEILQYSDGYVTGPSYPESVVIVKCVQRNCARLISKYEMQKIGTIHEYGEYPKEWESAYGLDQYKIGLAELEAAIADTFLGIPSEIAARKLLMRRYNDPFRDKENEIRYTISDKVRDNIDKLIWLTKNDDTENGLLLSAELHRLKGDFDKSIEILGTITGLNDDKELIRQKIFSMSKIGKARVFNFRGIVEFIEYICHVCGSSIIVPDLNKLKPSITAHLGLKHFKCVTEGNVFVKPTFKPNPNYSVRTQTIEKHTPKPEAQPAFIPNEISCPECHGSDLVGFDPLTDPCVKCGQGTYEKVKWFD